MSLLKKSAIAAATAIACGTGFAQSSTINSHADSQVIAPIPGARQAQQFRIYGPTDALRTLQELVDGNAPAPGLKQALASLKDETVAPLRSFNPPAKALPALSLKAGNLSGAQAVGALASVGKLSEVAARYGMTAAEFEKLLLKDSSIRIDKRGRLFYAGKFVEESATSFSSSNANHGLNVESVFKLESKPNALRTILLDFKGGVIRGTGWNDMYGASIKANPYNIDKDTNTLNISKEEVDSIYQIWKKVSEDFSMFDVNVTTNLGLGGERVSRTGNADETYGVRVIFTDDFTKQIQSSNGTESNCNCNSLSYSNSFNQTTDFYKPIFVFNKSIDGAAKSASQNIGHSLGLKHDGSDQEVATKGFSNQATSGSTAAGWAPIMGSPVVNGLARSTVQWSKGDYPGASNTEADFTVMRSNGLNLRTDDFKGHLLAGADLVPGTNDKDGLFTKIIHSDADVDAFKFSLPATVGHIQITTPVLSAGLDPKAVLYQVKNVRGVATPVKVAESRVVDNRTVVDINARDAYNHFVLAVSGQGKEPQVDNPANYGYSGYGSVGSYGVNFHVNSNASQSLAGVVVKSNVVQTFKAMSSTSAGDQFEIYGFVGIARLITASGQSLSNAEVTIATGYQNSVDGEQPGAEIRARTDKDGVLLYGFEVSQYPDSAPEILKYQITDIKGTDPSIGEVRYFYEGRSDIVPGFGKFQIQ